MHQEDMRQTVSPPALPPGRWSRLHSRCRNEACTTPEAPHKAHGLCTACMAKAFRKFRPEPKEAVRKRVARHRERKRSSELAERLLADRARLQADRKWRREHGIKDRRQKGDPPP